MKKITRYLVLSAVFLFIMFGIFGCTKSSSSTPTTLASPANTTPSTSMSIGSSSPTFSATAGYSGGTLTVTATSSGSSTVYSVVLHITASATGTYTLGAANTGWVNVTSGSNTTAYYTDASHTGTVVLTTLNIGSSHLATGTFSFTANETTPAPGAATISVSSGSFANLTW